MFCPNCGHATAHHGRPGCLERTEDGKFCTCELQREQAAPPKTPAQAVAERDAALDQVAQGTDATWWGAAVVAVTDLAARGETFTTDDVWDLLTTRGIPSPREPRAMGPVMKACLAAGTITPHGYVPSRRRHATPIREYTGARA